MSPEESTSRLIVIGGGCYGSYHARQLFRARDRGRIPPHEIVVVDRDPSCRAAAEFAGQPGFRLVMAPWNDFLDDYLGGLAADTPDRIVPTPLAPHLMFEWLHRRVIRKRPGGVIATPAFDELPDTPFASKGQPGVGYLSFATWTCPVTCYEPALCPAIGAPRWWEMNEAIFEYARRRAGAGSPFDLVEVFWSRHYAWGISAFEAGAAVRAGRRLDSLLARPAGGAIRGLVATVSSCHGVVSQFTIPAG